MKFGFTSVALLAAASHLWQAVAADCGDNDAEIARLARLAKLPGISNCADAKQAQGCDHPTHGATVQEVCCASCSSAYSCVNNDTEIARLATLAKLPGISNCADAKQAQYCDHPIYGTTVQEVCCESCSAPSCIDDNAEMARLAAEANMTGITACVDVVQNCASSPIVQATCCETCSTAGSVPPNDLPDATSTVRLFLLGGQSECVGQASVQDLDDDAATYPELQGDIDGVWFAGYKEPADSDRFFIRPMNGGDARFQFGPEISFGQRYHAVSNERVLMVKYCVGGSSVALNWNPNTVANSWNKTADNGTAQWLVDNAGLDFTSKNHLFINMIYTARKAQETLMNGGVPFEWGGIVWVQGMSDATGEDMWKDFGINTARVWEGFRQEIGNVPIIDTGASSINQLKSGKEYATQIVQGCQAVNIEPSITSNDDSSCQVSPTNPCAGEPGVYSNPAVTEYYGYDPNWPVELTPEGEANKIFHWFVSYPDNLHSAYEGMILQGRMLANSFLIEYTDYGLPVEFAEDDIYLRFRWEKCEAGSLPSPDNLCWIDYRDATTLALGPCVE